MTDDLCDDEREFFEERAAIGEYEGCWPRPIAEAEATRALEHRRWQLGKIRINRWPDCGRDESAGEPFNTPRPGSCAVIGVEQERSPASTRLQSD